MSKIPKFVVYNVYYKKLNYTTEVMQILFLHLVPVFYTGAH